MSTVRPNDLLEARDGGLFAPRGGFAVDPQRPVPLAIVTHAHADHARPGSECVVATPDSLPFLRHRLGPEVRLEALPERIPRRFGELEVTLFPAGHIRGSAQVRVSDGHETWVVSGDYKRANDPTARPFEVVPCDVFITEATFGLPIHVWPEIEQVIAALREDLAEAAAMGEPFVLFCYALGKAQRILAELGPDFAPVYGHGALLKLTQLYREAGVALPALEPIPADTAPPPGALILAPPSAAGSPWMGRFPRARTGFASGWMQIRGRRQQRGVGRGFVISDHADWPALLQTVRETGARRVLCTHGRSLVLARYLRETYGLLAEALEAPARALDAE